MSTFKIIETESTHIVYWIKNNVLYFRTSGEYNNQGSEPLVGSVHKTFARLILSLGLNNYTSERI